MGAPAFQLAPFPHRPGRKAGQLGSAVSSSRVDTMVDLLEMDRLKQSGFMEQRLSSLEEQVGPGRAACGAQV